MSEPPIGEQLDNAVAYALLARKIASFFLLVSIVEAGALLVCVL